MDFIINFLSEFWAMFSDMAFYIMLGLLIVGVLHNYVSKERIVKLLGKDSIGSVIKASVVGVPLPLCSCGVVPTAVQLKKSGASNGAVVSFLTSTPQTGVDSILATYSLMGGLMAFFRPIVAFISGIFTGIIVNIFAKKEKINVEQTVSSCHCGCEEEKEETHSCCCHEHEEKEETHSCCCHEHDEKEETHSCCCHEHDEQEETHSCCCHEHEEKEETHSCCCHEHEEKEETHSCCCHEHEEKEETHSCCCHEHEEKEETHSCCHCDDEVPTGKTKKFLGIFTYGFGSFLDEIAVHLVIGILLATLISVILPADFFVNLGLHEGIVSMLAMVVIGLPMYICSISSIPIAMSLIAKGLSFGSAFVFLFTGPVTNIASLLVLGKILGKKITTLYVVSVVVCSIAFGFLLDYITATFNITLNSVANGHHGTHGGVFTTIFALIFAVLILKGIVKTIMIKVKK